MAKEVLRDLDSDITRLLVAGASLAAADEGLNERKRALKELAAKAPALAKVSSQLEALTAAAGRKSASELLNLAAMSAQIRGAQAKPADGAGALSALEYREPMDSPLGSIAADKIFNVLTGTSDEPEHVLESALNENAVVDLRFARLVPNLVGGGIDDEIVVKVVKSYGEEAVRAIEREFDPKGGYGDRTRLTIIAEVRGRAALPLVESSFNDGSPEVRAEALTLWNKLDPERALRVALDRGIKDKADDVVNAATAILGEAHDNDEALEALLHLLVSRGDSRWSVITALNAFKHDKLSARLEELFTPELRSITEYKAPKAKKGAKAVTGSAAKAAKKEEEKRMREHHEKANLAEALARLLGQHFTARGEELLFETWKKATYLDVKYAAGEALAKTTRDDIRNEIMKGIEAKNYREREVAVTMLMADKEKAVERAKPYFDRKKLEDPKSAYVAASILQHIESLCEYDDDGNMVFKDLDPRWGAVIFTAFFEKNTRWIATPILAALKHPALFDELAKLMNEPVSSNYALEQMAALKDPRALALVLELMADEKVYRSVIAVRRYASGIAAVLRVFDDPSTAAPLRAFVAKIDKLSKSKGRREWYLNTLDNVLLYLERAR
jgi:hypothetical protein